MTRSRALVMTGEGGDSVPGRLTSWTSRISSFFVHGSVQEGGLE